MSAESIGIALGKWMGVAISGSAHLTRAIAIATLSVGEHLVSMVSSGLASDIGKVKERLERVDQAEADKRVAEAAHAHNEALRSRRTVLQRTREAELELEERAARIKVKEAKADAIRKDADSRRLKAIADANARTIEAISQLRQNGGEVFFDPENLRKLLQKQPPVVEQGKSSGSSRADADFGPA